MNNNILCFLRNALLLEDPTLTRVIILEESEQHRLSVFRETGCLVWLCVVGCQSEVQLRLLFI